MRTTTKEGTCRNKSVLLILQSRKHTLRHTQRPDYTDNCQWPPRWALRFPALYISSPCHRQEKGGRKKSNPLLRNDILPGNKAPLCWKIKLFLNVLKTTNYEAPGRESIWDFTMPPLSKLPLFPPKHESFKCRADWMKKIMIILKLRFRIEWLTF